MFETVMNVGKELPLGPDDVFIKELKEIYDVDPAIKQIIDGVADFILNRVLLPSYDLPQTPMVQKSRQILEFNDILNFIDGYKFGTVEITGSESKASICNKQIDNFKKIYWDDWQFLITDYETAFTITTWNRTGELYFAWVGKVFRWPYETVYNCYWSVDEMIYRYDDLMVPLFMQPMEEDGTFEKVGFWSNILFNVAFNAGYQLRDVLWIFYLTEFEGSPDEAV